jgi:hypothetical protein
MLLVFGSINVDLLFKIENLPRPGETVLCPGYEVAAGGQRRQPGDGRSQGRGCGAHGRPRR